MNKYIDVHHHILPGFYRDALNEAGIPKKFGISLPEWTLDSSKNMLEKYNIKSAITSISTPGVYIGDMNLAKDLSRKCNEYAVELSAKYPKLYGGFATLPLPFINETVEEIKYALDTLKMDGVTLLSNYDGKLLGNQYFEPVFRELNDRRTTVFIHPTIPSPCCSDMNFLPASMFEFVCDSSRTIINMLFSGIFEKYNRIRFIVPHAGGVIPYLAGRIDLYPLMMPKLMENIPKGALYYLKNLYYDVAMSTSKPTLRCLNEFVSADKILMGTDYPFVSENGIDQILDSLEKYPNFSNEELELIKYKNMEILFPKLKK
jgi:6-methylsalicylate decarboxylase